MFKGDFGPVKQSKAFQTEQEARAYADGLKVHGYVATVWRG